MKDKRNQVWVGLAIVAAILLGANVLLGPLLSWARSDWTEDRLFTIATGTRTLVAELPEPVRLELYWSASTAKDLPTYKAHAQRVREFLEELVSSSDGKLSLEVLDPEPFSEAEDEATSAGLAALPINGVGSNLTLGLVGYNSVDRREVIPFLDPEKEGLLEYDVAKLIHSLELTSPPKVVVLSGAPIAGAPDPSGNPMAQGTPPWLILRQLREVADVEVVEPTATELPADTDVLVLVHPKGLSDELLHAIDAYAFAGGDLVVFVDPHCEAAAAPPNPMMGGPQGPEPSDLAPLLAAWGVAFDPTRVVGDRKYAQPVSFRGQRGIVRLDMVVWLSIPAEGTDQKNPIVAKLDSINLASAGYLEVAEGRDIRLQPLLESSDEAGTLVAAQVASYPDPQGFSKALVPHTGKLTLAARVVGKIQRAYPDAANAVDGANGADTPATADAGGILVVADADILADKNWIQEQRLGSISLGYQQFADNGALLLNVVEALAGDQVLINLRGGGTAQRPFLVVDELRREAQARYQEREQALQAEITTAQGRITELQRSKTGDDRMILSAEQDAELNDLQDKVLTARKELRAVRHGLQEDIARLGTRLMLLNVLGVPALVALLAGLLLWRQNHRSRS